jgi:cytochrome c-type biogenesis protein CcmH
MAAVTENPDPARSAIAQMVEGLADRLAQEPDDQQGWEMLGRSYMQLERYQEAADAWREAWRLSEGESVEVAVNFAEALVMSDPAQLRAGAGDLLDAVLDVEPNNSKALWYGGLSAAARGQTDIAEQRWASLLSDPKLPPNVRQLVQQQLAAMGANVPAAPAASTGPAMFRVSIELAPEFAEQVAAGQALFLFARDADGARPPVAVKRLTIDEFPMTTTLRDTDVMMPGLKLTGMENLRIVARVSQSGNAMESAGDFYGEVFPEPLGQSSQKVQVVIDKVVQ